MVRSTIAFSLTLVLTEFARASVGTVYFLYVWASCRGLHCVFELQATGSYLS